MEKIKVTIGVPTNRGIKPKTALSLLEMANNPMYDFHYVIATEGYTTAENRTYIAIQAIKNGSQYLLFVDDDMIFPKDTLDRLIATGKDIVGVASNSRVLPKSPTPGLMDENGNYIHPDSIPNWELPTELFKAYSVGGGVLLINMKVFETLAKPWFHFDTFTEGEFAGKIRIGEDNWFCQQAKKAGFEVWCDPTLSIGHIGDYIY